VSEQEPQESRPVTQATAQFMWPTTPEFYADAVRINLTPYGVRLDYGLTTDSPNDSRAVATVRMSPQHAVVMYQMLKKSLRLFEEQVGKINLPDALYTELDIEREV
jgi:Protein of unknown function (DUF3467)